MNNLKFTVEEINLMCCYNIENRTVLLKKLSGLTLDLIENDQEMMNLINGVIKRLTTLTDEEYEQIKPQLIPALD